MYMALTAFIQFSILLTRNPSFWWHFGPNRWVGVRAGWQAACTGGWLHFTPCQAAARWRAVRRVGSGKGTLPPPAHRPSIIACALPACSAPRPSLVLIAPVLSFIVGSMFLAVYWPRDTQPDGGRAVLEGAGVSGAAEPAGQCCSPQLRRNMAQRPRAHACQLQCTRVQGEVLAARGAYLWHTGGACAFLLHAALPHAALT